MDRVSSIDPLVGQLLDGRYLMGARIARGGMATVYEATDLRLDRPVAVKVVALSLSDNEEFARRFVREARAAARLTHPNVVTVYDQGDDDGMLFLAMEFVAGRRTMRDLIRAEAPLPPGRAVAMLEPILEALAAAHEAGIIHRDVKPENVLLTPAGRPKVADFGLARAISSATTATATGGVLLGTVSYLPPELVTDGTADARSDVYALGVLLFELLTGTKPHSGETPIQVAYKHVHEDVPPPSTRVDGIPPYVDAFVVRATARRRELRPADAHVMLQQLRRVRHAYDHGIPDDEELTEDLTPTVAVGHSGDDYRAAGHEGRDEVFDIDQFDDFARQVGPSFAPPPVYEHTLVVGGGDVSTPGSQRRGVVTTDEGSASGADGPGADPAGPHATSPPAGWDHLVPPSRAARRRQAGWIALVLVLLLTVAAGLGGWWYGVARFQSTPDVVRLSKTAARDRLESAGLQLEIAGNAYSAQVPQGHVLSTDPPPGDRVLDNGTVELVVSRGPRPIRVADYTGGDAEPAVDELQAEGLQVERRQRYDDDVEAGEVIRQRPDRGVLQSGDRVILVVSRGPLQVEVPDVLGSGVEAAEETLRDAGFEVSVQEYSLSLGVGFVAEQTPGGGDLAAAGSTIVIFAI